MTSTSWLEVDDDPEHDADTTIQEPLKEVLPLWKIGNSTNLLKTQQVDKFSRFFFFWGGGIVLLAAKSFDIGFPSQSALCQFRDSRSQRTDFDIRWPKRIAPYGTQV